MILYQIFGEESVAIMEISKYVRFSGTLILARISGGGLNETCFPIFVLLCVLAKKSFGRGTVCSHWAPKGNTHIGNDFMLAPS